MKDSLLPVFLCICTMVSAHEDDSIRMEERGGKHYVIHQVDPGETMFSLSQRYGVESDFISLINRIENNALKVGQFLEIPYRFESWPVQYHEVKRGETLFSISKLYGVDVRQIRRWNDLRSNRISIGQRIIIGEEKLDEGSDEPAVVDSAKAETNEKFEYYVQTGENMVSISRKLNVSPDSIRAWNNLISNRLRIGQKLVFPFEIDPDSLSTLAEENSFRRSAYGSKIKANQEGGITKVFEEGVAKKIETTIDTKKYLALHRNLKIGSILQVRNLMNNEVIYVRIVGKLPDTGINENVMVRLTPIAFERLGIVDDRSLVEINYFKD